MFIIGYLAQDDAQMTAVQERLSFATPPMALVTARNVTDLLTQTQTLPLRALLVDAEWPRSTWTTLIAELAHTHPGLPVLALAPGATSQEWWRFALDLVRLDEPLDLFLHRIERARKPQRDSSTSDTPPKGVLPAETANPVTVSESPGFLENPQFRHFAQIFSSMEETPMLEAFASWAQQACQTSRLVVLFRDPQSGDFLCRAQRGLPSTLVPHCRFSQTAPLCRWLTSTGRILVRDGSALYGAMEALDGLDLLQAVAVVPIMFDGQLVGMLGIGPRLVGPSYSIAEFEGLFALGGQLAMAIHHRRAHHAVRTQQEMTEQLLGVMPTGTIVLGEDQRIAFVNTAGAAIVGRSRANLQGADLRALPSPLGDLAYEAIRNQRDIPRQELTLGATQLPVAVSGLPLATTPPSALLLIEDLTALKRLDEERERRVDLEVVTNLVHYLAHELRNPLVALSTFSNLVSTRASEPDFQEFCESILQSEIARVNLILEQLLVLTHHAEFQFDSVDLAPVIERITASEEMRAAVVVALPMSLPVLYGDPHRLETALTCLVRTIARLTQPPTPATLRVESDADEVIIHAEVPNTPESGPDWLLDPWKQLMGKHDEQVDFGLATAQYIIEQHHGSLTVAVTSNVLTIVCRLPLRADHHSPEEGWHDATQSTRRR